MQTHKHVQDRLTRKERLIMDGAMGTEILRHGVPTTLPLWSAEALLTHPHVVQHIHEEYIAAGADIIITDTFRTTRRTFAKKGIAEKARETTLLACQIARHAIEQVHPHHSVLIAGSMAPLEDCYSPELTPSHEELLTEHEAYARDLTEGGVDFLLIETMITLRETMAAIRAARKLAMPFAVSFCTNAQGHLLGGEPLTHVVKHVAREDPLFLGVNCVTPAIATQTLHVLKNSTTKPLSVYAQGDGIPQEDQGWAFQEEQHIENYLLHAKQWIQGGAHIIGGCCGTSPAYIERLRTLV